MSSDAGAAIDAGPIDRVVRTIVREMLLAAGPLGLLLAVYYGLWGELTRSSSRTMAVLSNVALFAVYLVVLTIGGAFVARRQIRRASPFLDESRDPTRTEATALARLPSSFARLIALAMVVMASVTAIGNITSDGVRAEAVRIFAGLSLMGLMIAVLVYLITERAMRPMFRLSLVAEERMSAIGVRARLLLAWALGSGIPLVFILAIPLQGDAADRLPTEVPMIFMACLGLVAGVTTLLVSARSIAEPLTVLRKALARIEGGDLETPVTVDDPGEVGQLQRGVNRMIEGLRQRRTIEDLFGRHVGEDVARLAVEMGADFRGEQRDAAVLFVDIVGSTELAQSHEAEAVMMLLNGFFAHVVEAVRTEGGWVNKFEGDAALCVFGAPVSRDDAPRAALRAARGLQEALARSPLVAGIGVSFGAVVAGNVGSEDRYEYTVIGPAVNEAARLTEEAKQRPERVLADVRAVRRSGDEAAAWREIGGVTLRGVGRPVEVAVPVVP